MGAMRWCRRCTSWVNAFSHCGEPTSRYTDSAHDALRRALDEGLPVDHRDLRNALDELDEAHPVAETMPAALTAARAEGYAECQADVVAWLLWKVSTLKSHTYGQDDERKVLERVMDGIEDACHVGAAKKGGE